MHCGHSASAAPAQHQCSASAVPMQYQCNALGVPVQLQRCPFRSAAPDLVQLPGDPLVNTESSDLSPWRFPSLAGAGAPDAPASLARPHVALWGFLGVHDAGTPGARAATANGRALGGGPGLSTSSSAWAMRSRACARARRRTMRPFATTQRNGTQKRNRWSRGGRQDAMLIASGDPVGPSSTDLNPRGPRACGHQESAASRALRRLH